MTFQELGLMPLLLKAVAEEGYETPSPIQQQAIPHAITGRDVLGCAQTGTGKTCAFATPILQRLSQNKAATKAPQPIRALILTPTRELALQIEESFEAYGRHLPLRSAVIFGGVGQAPQVAKLRRGLDILVATPGRLIDLHGQKLIDLSHIEIFVLDEADRMLDMGFINDVKKILQWLPKKKQTLFFSATMPPEISDLADSLLNNPAKVAVDPVSSPVEIIQQSLYYVDRTNKTKLLAHLMKQEGKNAIVFTRTKHGANKVTAGLIKEGIPAAAIHGNKSQTARQQALADFKKGKVHALVATDIAARGIDINELALVFNYNLPEVPETYVHRIGRTGRAGHGGTAISFCEVGEKGYLKDVERLIKKAIPVVSDHPYPMEVFEVAKDAKGRTVNSEDAESRQAAKERRRTRQEEQKQAKEAAQAKKAKNAPATAKVQEPKKTQEPKGVKQTKKPQQPQKATQNKVNKERPTAAQNKSRAGYRPSATLEEALHAMEPKGDYREEDARLASKRRSAALDGNVIMDATARLLASKKPATSTPASQTKKVDTQNTKKQPTKQQPVKQQATKAPEQKSKTQPQRKATTQNQGGNGATQGNKKQNNRNYNRRSTQPEIRRDNQKDSTEQDSLMKPYYLSDN